MSTSPHAGAPLLDALRRLRTDLAVHDRVVAETARVRDSDLTVLEVLHREGPQTPTVLARTTNTHLATMTGVLTRLEREGWIERRADANDRRSVRIHAASVDRFNALYADSVARLHTVFSGWSPEQAQAFLSSITDIAQALEAPREAGSPAR